MGTNEIKFNTNKYIQYRHLIPLETFQVSPWELASSSREGICLLLKELFFSLINSREETILEASQMPLWRFFFPP
jgi:hypothetical protein